MEGGEEMKFPRPSKNVSCPLPRSFTGLANRAKNALTISENFGPNDFCLDLCGIDLRCK